MKQLSKLFLLTMLVVFASCQNESTEEQAADEQRAALRFDEKGNVISDGEEDRELMFNENSEILNQNDGIISVGMSNTTSGTAVIQKYTVIDADRAPNSNDGQPVSNMWWSITGTDYDSPSSYFSTVGENNLTFTEYADGSANLTGTTVSGTCSVDLDV